MFNFSDNEKCKLQLWNTAFHIQKDIFRVGEEVVGPLKLLLGEYNDTTPLETTQQYIAIVLICVYLLTQQFYF